jgi:DNA repair ATPase RecN
MSDIEKKEKELIFLKEKLGKIQKKKKMDREKEKERKEKVCTNNLKLDEKLNLLRKRREDIKNQVEKLKENGRLEKVSLKDSDKLNRTISKLKTLTKEGMIKPKYTQEYILETSDINLKYNHHLEWMKHLELESDITIHPLLKINPNEKWDSLKSWKKQKKLYIENIKNHEDCIIRCKTQLDQLEKIEDPTNDIHDCKENIKEWNEIIDKHERMSIMKPKFDSIKSKEKSLNEVFDKWSNMTKFQEIAKKTEHDMLKSAVNIINDILSQTSTDLFDDEIQMSIQVYKEIGDKGDERPEIHFHVENEGVGYKKFDILSGGELSRCSIGLTLAFNQLSQFPLMFMDETMGSVDSILKEKCLECLRTNTDRGVVVIMQDGVKGIFDSMIDLED